MKEDAVERVLRGLGTAEAPSGLERRVLRRLAERGTARASGRGSVVGAAMAMAMLLFGAWMIEREPATPPQTVRLSEMGHPGNSGVMRESGPRELKPGWSRAAYPTAEALGLTRRKTRFPLGGGAAPAHVSEARHGTPGLVARMESFPAPPLPLTEEEKLLRRIAVAGSEPAFELLNEETREAALAASDAEFEAFVRSAPSRGRAAGSLNSQR